MVENLTNRFWKFIKRPEGKAYDEAFTLEETPLVAPVDGQVVVKNQYLSLDAGTRMWITEREDGYQPPLDLNIPMVGLGVGEVIASSDPNFSEGDLVRGFGQWADYSVVTAELSGLMKLDKSIDASAFGCPWLRTGLVMRHYGKRETKQVKMCWYLPVGLLAWWPARLPKILGVMFTARQVVQINVLFWKKNLALLPLTINLKMWRSVLPRLKAVLTFISIMSVGHNWMRFSRIWRLTDGLRLAA